MSTPSHPTGEPVPERLIPAEGADWREGDERSFTRRWQAGEVVVEGQIAQGGDTLWTSSVIKLQLGRPRKRGSGRVAGKTLDFIMPRRTSTREEALRLAEEAFERFVRSEDSRLPAGND